MPGHCSTSKSPKALEQARVGRLHILGIMKEACSEHATKLPPSVPRIIYKPIDPSKVGKLIGPGGSTINSIISESGVTNIAVDGDAGTVCISGLDDDAIDDAINRIDAVVGGGGGRPIRKQPMPKIAEGETFSGRPIKTVVPFGLCMDSQRRPRTLPAHRS